ncbi:MAG: hypothetical protein SGJ21_03440, partial [Alphaproteobacteria bacterium]|nr:hypothetical protein [Alphaproteobacteria bacterium]
DDLLFRKSALAHLASSLSRTLQIRGRISGGWVSIYGFNGGLIFYISVNPHEHAKRRHLFPHTDLS